MSFVVVSVWHSDTIGVASIGAFGITLRPLSSTCHSRTVPEGSVMRRNGLPSTFSTFAAFNSESFTFRRGMPLAVDVAVVNPRFRIITTKMKQKNTNNDPLMNCTQVVETMPAVTTITVTVRPTSSTPH